MNVLPFGRGQRVEGSSTRRAIARNVGRAWRTHPRLLLATAAITLATAVADCLYPPALKTVVDGVAQESATQLNLGVAGLVVGVGAGWGLRIAGTALGQVFERRIGMQLRTHVVDLHARLPRMDHLERPEEVTRLELLRHKVYALEQWYGSFFGTVGSLLRIGLLTALALSAQPAAVVLVPLAVVPVAVTAWRERVLERVEAQVAPAARRSQHFYDIATQRPLAMEVRILGYQARAAAQFTASYQEWYDALARARLAGLAWLTLAWAVFGVALTAVLVSDSTERSPGDVVLTAAALGQMTLFVAMAATEAPYLRRWTRATRDLTWLEDQAYPSPATEYPGDSRDAQPTEAVRPAPGAQAPVVCFEHVSFRYPSSEDLALDDVSFTVPGGSVVAVVGVNGAGKSTLLHLLSGFARPSRGRITVAGLDLDDADLESMRERMSACYQESFRFAFTVRQVIEMGTAAGTATGAEVHEAAVRSGFSEVLQALPSGLETQLGAHLDGGVDLSGGQWQRLALARSFMRPEAVVLMLDEPSAALDAQTERDVLRSLADRAEQARAQGSVTFVVSHRLSVARLVDRVLVLDAGRLVQIGTHADLVDRAGPYRDLYLLQAGGYS